MNVCLMDKKRFKMVKINVVKFEVLEGKKMGKSLTFPVDPVVMAQFMTRAKVVKMIEEYVRKTGVFGTGEMSGLVYEMDEFLAEWRKEVKKRKELLNN